MIGISLADLLAREQPPDGIPLICHRLVGYLRANGLDKEGVFRVPGRQQLVRTITITCAHCIFMCELIPFRTGGTAA